MSGIKDLKKLLKEMNPVLSDKQFVFCTVSESYLKSSKLSPLLVFREKEGVTIVIEKNQAEDLNLSYSATWRLITLNVHSDLTAVGFLDRVTAKLADAGISVNVVSAYHHDHMFVPLGKEEKAMKLLVDISSQNQTEYKGVSNVY